MVDINITPASTFIGKTNKSSPVSSRGTFASSHPSSSSSSSSSLPVVPPSMPSSPTMFSGGSSDLRLTVSTTTKDHNDDHSPSTAATTGIRTSKSNVSSIASTAVRTHDDTPKNVNIASVNKFLTKTYHMIDTATSSQSSSSEGSKHYEVALPAISWSNGGSTFTINDVERFQNEWLPKYFNHSKYTSFVRQLNFYGFMKLTTDPDLQTRHDEIPNKYPKTRFYHRYFQKDRPNLLSKIQRTTSMKPAVATSLSRHGKRASVQQQVSPPSDEQPTTMIRSLQNQIDDLKRQMSDMKQSWEEKLQQTTLELTQHYFGQVQHLERRYEQRLLLNRLLIQQPPSSLQSTPNLLSLSSSISRSSYAPSSSSSTSSIFPIFTTTTTAPATTTTTTTSSSDARGSSPFLLSSSSASSHHHHRHSLY